MDRTACVQFIYSSFVQVFLDHGSVASWEVFSQPGQFVLFLDER